MTPYQAFVEAYNSGKRLPELEDIIMTSSHESYRYARQVIKGKLPEKMHNMMILHAIKELDLSPHRDYPRWYFDFIASP